MQIEITERIIYLVAAGPNLTRLRRGVGCLSFVTTL